MLCGAGSLAGLCYPHAQSEPQKEGQRQDLSPRSLARVCAKPPLLRPGPGDVCLHQSRLRDTSGLPGLRATRLWAFYRTEPPA